MVKLSSRSQEQSWELNVPQHTLAYIWIRWRKNFWRSKSINLSHGFDISMIFFFIWTHGEGKLKTFLENLNQFHPNIKFTHESSTESIPFLDLRVKLSQGKLETDLHIKPTDRHQYLHYSSSHPGHTKRSIVYSQTLRVARVCSHEADCRKHTTEMKPWFLNCSYPNNVTEKEMKKVKFSK